MLDFTFIYIAIGIIALAGLWLGWACLRRLRNRRLFSGSLQGLASLLCLSLVALAVAIGLNLYTYHRFTYERPVAQLRVEAKGPQYFNVYLLQDGESGTSYELRGDEWQVDARLLKWQGLATLAGADSVYRLERISGRYRDIRQARSSNHSVHDLAMQQGLDLWSLAKQYNSVIPWFDSIYGNAAYMPLADKATYEISISQTGLIVRPGNEAARLAIEQWQ